MKNIKTIIWDFDGTLANSHEAIFHCARLAFSDSGVTEEEVNIAFNKIVNGGLIFSDACKALGLPEEKNNYYFDRYRDNYSKYAHDLTTLFPKVEETLSKLNSTGILNLVFSNKREQIVIEAVAKKGLTKYFSKVYGILENGAKKPEIEVFTTRILPDYPNIIAETTIVVGDTIADMQLAKNIGAGSCFAKYGSDNGYGTNLVMNINPDWVINGVEEVLQLFV